MQPLKKKELLGNFYRDGVIDTQETIATNDHDFGSAGVGTVIPHSLYDVGRTTAYGEIKAKRLHVVKVGKRTLVPADSAESWLKNLPTAQAVS